MLMLACQSSNNLAIHANGERLNVMRPESSLFAAIFFLLFFSNASATHNIKKMVLFT